MSGIALVQIPNLPPATAPLSPADLIIVSQNGIARVAPLSDTASFIFLPAGTLLGNPGTAEAAVGPIALGANFEFVNGTLEVSGLGTGSVTEVVAGRGLSGGTITGTGTITLDIATASALGGIIAGAGLSVDVDGTLSANFASPPAIGDVTAASAIFGTYISAGTSGIDDAGGLNLTGNGSINFTGTGDIAMNGGAISGVTSLSATGNITTTGSLISGVNINGTGTLNISGAVTLGGTAGDLTAAAHGNAYIAESGTAYIADNAGTLFTGTVISNGSTLVNGTVGRSFQGTVAAAGSVQADAATITAEVCIITSATAGTGVRALAGPTPPFAQFVRNMTSIDVNFYPAIGGQFDQAGTNAAVLIVAYGNITITAISSTEWVSS
jgi:hypothetical protein